MDAYSQAMDERASQIVENLGTLETAWKTVAGVAKGAWTKCSAWAGRRHPRNAWSN
ncbi:hypothetical protein [Pseudomonas aeruginosa]|uniref:hypothetical protein n=1 Tax=Pseudomonas aeruginosa TaxID=287 RepID=UPI000B0588B1